jgi:cellulose biosynthesis protein BcsQ
MIENLLTIGSGKGGVGKSLLTANLAGHAARGGWHVLAIDFDRSGDLAVNLGYSDRSDAGLAVADAAISRSTPRVITEVRPGLDVIAGGPHVDRLAEVLADAEAAGEEPHLVLEEMLAPLAATKNLVMIDLPPTAGILHRAVYGVAGHIAVPTAVDRCSLNGLGAVFERFREARATTSPDLELLGVILNGVDLRATTVTAEVTARLHDLLGDTVAVLGPPIRWAPKAVYDMREAGLLAAEYDDEAVAETKRRLGRLRRTGSGGTSRRYAANASTFANDLAEVAEAVLGAYSASLAARRAEVDLRDTVEAAR